MPSHDLLPPEYQSEILHKKHPLRVGTIVENYDWGYNRKTALDAAYLWRIEEGAAGKYYLVALGAKKRVLLPKDYRYSLIVATMITRRLSILDYPEHHTRILNLGWGAFFGKDYGGGVVLHLRKGGHSMGMGLDKAALKDVRRDPTLLRAWLEQVIWCLQHPRLSDALDYKQGQSEELLYGEWPNLATPEELSKAGREALKTYVPYSKRHGAGKALNDVLAGTGVTEAKRKQGDSKPNTPSA